MLRAADAHVINPREALCARLSLENRSEKKIGGREEQSEEVDRAKKFCQVCPEDILLKPARA